MEETSSKRGGQRAEGGEEEIVKTIGKRQKLKPSEGGKHEQRGNERRQKERKMKISRMKKNKRSNS